MTGRNCWLTLTMSVVIALWLATGTALAQDQLILNPYSDTWIKRSDLYDRGSYDYLNVAGTMQSSSLLPQESTLLRFNLNELHPHDWIDHADLTMHVDSGSGIDIYNLATVGLFALNTSWSSNANWTRNHPDYNMYWSQPGCEGSTDRDSTPDATVQFTSYSGAGDYVWQSQDLIDTVRDWHTGARYNGGWLMRLYGGIYQNGKTDRVQFCSNDWTVADDRPELNLLYHREAIAWKDDGSGGGVWDTTSANWTWIGGNTHYVDGSDPDEVSFSQVNGGGGLISIAGTVSPKSIAIRNQYWTFQGGSIGGTGGITVGNGGEETCLRLKAANSFTGRVSILSCGIVEVSANNALGGVVGGQYTTVYDGGTLVFTDGVDYTANETVYIQGDGSPFTTISGALGSEYASGNNRFRGVVRVLGDSTVCVGGDSSLDLTQSLYMYSDYELNVNGGGTLILSGPASAFNGRYVVHSESGSSYATRLLVNNLSGSATGAGSVTLKEHSILGGRGSIAGAVFAEDESVISPGTSIGTLTLGSLELSEFSCLDFELNQPGHIGSVYNDLLIVHGDLILDGILNITADMLFGEGTYRLITYDTEATLTNLGLEFGDMPAGYLYELSTANPGSVELIVQQIPEPTSLGLLAIGALAMFRRR